MSYSVQNFEAFSVDEELSGFLLQGSRMRSPKRLFAPLKGVCHPLKLKKQTERTIETIAYCFKNNGLLSFPVLLKFYLAELSQTLSICSVLLRASLACERGDERKGEEKEELSSSHIYYTLSRQEKFHNLSLDFKRKFR